MTDNADLMFLRDAIEILLPKLASVIHKLSTFALKYRDLPCLGYTHGQAAQLVTVGKRATIWIEDLLDDLHNLEHQRERLLSKFRGVKGTTGTQASFLAIFKGDHSKVKKLDDMVTEKSGFNGASRSTTQTYSRKIDVDIIHALASFGCTAERIGGDIRHLAMFKELEEPFEADQVSLFATSEMSLVRGRLTMRYFRLDRALWRTSGIPCARNGCAPLDAICPTSQALQSRRTNLSGWSVRWTTQPLGVSPYLRVSFAQMRV